MMATLATVSSFIQCTLWRKCCMITSPKGLQHHRGLYIICTHLNCITGYDILIYSGKSHTKINMQPVIISCIFLFTCVNDNWEFPNIYQEVYLHI